MVLLDNRLDAALLGLVNGLRLHVLALGAHAARCIHTLLESIALPPEDVISVLAIAGVIAIAEVEGLGAIRGPLSLVVERSGVPDNLVHELRNTDGVTGWAVASQAQESSRAIGRVGNVRPVIRAVKIFAVPATSYIVSGAQSFLPESQTHVGKWMLDRIPPLHGSLGNSWVSIRASWQGAAVSPPKLGPV